MLADVAIPNGDTFNGLIHAEIDFRKLRKSMEILRIPKNPWKSHGIYHILLYSQIAKS